MNKLIRARPVTTVCLSNRFRKPIETKRITHIKENFNKLINIGKAEIDDYVVFFKELDEYHRNLIKNRKNPDKDEINIMSSDEFLS